MQAQGFSDLKWEQKMMKLNVQKNLNHVQYVVDVKFELSLQWHSD